MGQEHIFISHSNEDGSLIEGDGTVVRIEDSKIALVLRESCEKNDII